MWRRICLEGLLDCWVQAILFAGGCISDVSCSADTEMNFPVLWHFEIHGLS